MTDTREILSDEEALEVLSRHMGDKRPIRAVIDEFARRAGVSGRRVDGCASADVFLYKPHSLNRDCQGHTPATLYIHDAPKSSAEERIEKAIKAIDDWTERGKIIRILRGEE